MVVPVILSGGSGKRLWPLSREAYPKQFLPLHGKDTMLQATWRRVAPLASVPPLVVSNEAHQMHHHRVEHWIVVSGTGRITRGDEEVMLSENQSNYIPLGVKHRLDNPGRMPLELIEVQSGSYLGEDDIVRSEDVYGRG